MARIFDLNMIPLEGSNGLPPAPLMWINKTGGSHSLSNERGTSKHHEIMSHVQKRSKDEIRQRRSEKTLEKIISSSSSSSYTPLQSALITMQPKSALKNARSQSLGGNRISAAGRKKDKQTAASSTNLSAAAATSALNGSSSSCSNISPVSASVEVDDLAIFDKDLKLNSRQTQQRQIRTLPNTKLPAYHIDGIFDPFNSATSTLDPYTLTLLQAFTIALNPAGCHLSVMTQTPRQQALSEPLRASIVTECMVSPIAMTSFLASLACFAEHVKHVGLESPNSTVLIGKALSSLQSDLRSAPVLNHCHLLAVVHLTTAEAYKGNLEGARIHLKAAQQLAILLGGLRNVGLYLRHTLIGHDLYLGMEHLTKPLFPLDFDPGSLDEEILRRCRATVREVEELGTGFRVLLTYNIIDTSMMQIVEDLVQCMQVVHYGHVTGYVELHVTRWTYLRMSGIRHRLLSLKLEACDRQARTIRVVLLLWTLVVSPALFSKRAMRSVIARLKEVVAPSCERVSPLMKWVVVLGALATEISGTEEGPWFLMRVRGSFANQGLNEREVELAMQSVPRQFFYLDRLQHGGMKRLARKVAQLQPPLPP